MANQNIQQNTINKLLEINGQLFHICLCIIEISRSQRICEWWINREMDELHSSLQDRSGIID